MRTRLIAVALALTAVACGEGRPGVSSAPAPTYANDAERVKAALEATREKGTAAFVVDSVTAYAGVTGTLRREGVYDLENDRARLTQSKSTEPPESFADFWGPASPDEHRQRMVTASGKKYVEIGGRWYHAPPTDIPRARRFDELDVKGLPVAVAVLDDARPAAREGSGDTAYVTIPAGSAYIAFPTLVIRKLMLEMDPERLPGEVEVEVTVKDGVITGLTFDATAVQRAAWAAWAASGTGKQPAIESARLTVTLSAHGEPVTVDVPTDVVMP